MASRVSNFDVWWAQHPEINQYIKPIPHTKKWVTIRCEQKQYTKLDKRGHWDKTSNIRTVYYDAIMCTDPKSRYAGNIYNNDSYRDLSLKFLGLFSIVRPWHAIISTAYHMMGGGVLRAVIIGSMKHQKTSYIAKQALRSVADIFRTPFYCALMGGAALIGVVGGICHKPALYDARAFTGFCMSKLYRGQRTDLSFSPCMYRLVNVTFFEQRHQTRYSDTAYQYIHRNTLLRNNPKQKCKKCLKEMDTQRINKNRLLVGLTNLARTYG